MVTIQDYYSQSLIVLCIRKTEDVYEDFSNDKEMFDFSNCSTKSKYYDSSNKLVVGKMKGKIVGVAIERFVRLKPKMKSYLEDDNKLTISHNLYKGVL